MIAQQLFYWKDWFNISSRQDKTAILGKISPIFRSFSAYFPPMVPNPPTCLRITPISAYFSPIFRLWYPTLIINSSICCSLPFAVLPPTCLQILLIFRLFSAYFPPKIPPIFRPSCLAGLGVISLKTAKVHGSNGILKIHYFQNSRASCQAWDYRDFCIFQEESLCVHSPSGKCLIHQPMSQHFLWELNIFSNYNCNFSSYFEIVGICLKYS